jgi:hypothetical protein
VRTDDFPDDDTLTQEEEVLRLCSSGDLRITEYFKPLLDQDDLDFLEAFQLEEDDDAGS